MELRKNLLELNEPSTNTPDFDIFIDDNPYTIQQLISQFPNKTFVVPDYKMNRHIVGENIYHSRIAPIELKDEDFTIAVLEMENEQLKEREKEKEATNLVRISISVYLLLLVIILIIKLIKSKNNKK